MKHNKLHPPKNRREDLYKKGTRKVSKETREEGEGSGTGPARRVLLEVVVHGDTQEIGLVLGWTEEADGLRASQVDLDARTTRGIRRAARQLLGEHAQDVALRIEAVQLYLEKGIPVSDRIRGAILLRQAVLLERRQKQREADGKKPLTFEDYEDLSKEVQP